MKKIIEDAVSYRTPLRVTEIFVLPDKTTFPVCPRCQNTIERDYQSYCDRCGQCLEWKYYYRAKAIRWKPPKKK